MDKRREADIIAEFDYCLTDVAEALEITQNRNEGICISDQEQARINEEVIGQGLEALFVVEGFNSLLKTMNT